LQPNFAAVLGQATAIDVQVADGCGNLVGPGGQSAYVAATVTGGDPTIAMTHIGNGIWQGTWKPVNATGGVTLFVTALGPNGVGGQNKVSGAVSAPAPAAATPTVTAQGVVHAASDAAGVPIAPGGLITVYGVNLSDAVGQNTGLPLPQQLNGTQVLLGNQPLPILYTSTGQLNVQVPFTAPVNTQYQLTVQHGNALSLPQSLVVAAGLPGIFTVNQQGTGQGAIMRSDGVTLAQPGTPASIGETVVIYCTGLGAVTPAVKEGLPAPATPPLSTTVNPVTVTIGGTAAQVAFSGLTPGYAGLYQVNAVVPAGITTGDTVPVVVSVAGQDSPPVTIAVR
jgi:adhesin/invasin